jgi:hypothetical protein
MGGRLMIKRIRRRRKRVQKKIRKIVPIVKAVVKHPMFKKAMKIYIEQEMRKHSR